MTYRLLIRALSFGLVVSLGSAPAFAQTLPQTEAQPAGPAKSATRAASGASDATTAPGMGRAHPMVERRIGDLRDRLRITAVEQPAFDAFADVMRGNAGRMDGLTQTRRNQMATLSAVDQMKGYEELARAHFEDMQRLVPAFEHLYDTLSPDQKKLADSSFRDFAKSGGRNRT